MVASLTAFLAASVLAAQPAPLPGYQPLLEGGAGLRCQPHLGLGGPLGRVDVMPRFGKGTRYGRLVGPRALDVAGSPLRILDLEAIIES